MALTQKEMENLQLEVLHQLSQTRYACHSMEIVSGGTTNFLFRSYLVQPSSDGQSTVIVKHSKPFVSGNRDFGLDISRSTFEVAMLRALKSFHMPPLENFSVRTPHLYFFDPQHATQVLEDLLNTIDLKTVLESPEVSALLPIPVAIVIGRVLGAWLQSFHLWVSEPAQAVLKYVSGDNSPMRKTRYAISYGAFLDVVKRFPDVWEGKQEVLEQVRDMAIAEYAKTSHDSPGKNWGLIHGDFWTGNVLLPRIHDSEDRPDHGKELFVIDWELAQFGRKEYDLGQLIGDLYERRHFTGLDSALHIIEGFAAGYGPLTDDEVFRIAIHAGQHLICWYIRRDPKAPFTQPMDQIESAIRIGTEFIVHGWERDREWFDKSDLSCLFKKT